MEQDSLLYNFLDDCAAHLPRFPDGRINFKGAKKAPGLACFVRFQSKILLLKRSDKVGSGKGKWYCVAGYLDEYKPIKEKVLEELREELGIGEDNLQNLVFFDPWEQHDEASGMRWTHFPVLVDLKKLPQITLDWEHTEYKWVLPEDIGRFDVLESLWMNLKRVTKRLD